MHLVRGAGRHTLSDDERENGDLRADAARTNSMADDRLYAAHCHAANSSFNEPSCNCLGTARHAKFNSRPTIKVILSDWIAAGIDAFLLKVAIEEVLGFAVELIPSYADNFKGDASVIDALGRGDAHIYPEVGEWGSPIRNGHPSSDRSSLACRFGGRRRSTATTSECTATKRCGPHTSANACSVASRARWALSRPGHKSMARPCNAGQNMPTGRAGRVPRETANDRPVPDESNRQVVSAGPLGVLGRSAIRFHSCER
jgi:hypothetical protein